MRPIRVARWRRISPRWWREEAFGALKAPILMVTPPHTPVPFSPALEDLYIPSVASIVAAVQEILGYSSGRAAE